MTPIERNRLVEAEAKNRNAGYLIHDAMDAVDPVQRRRYQVQAAQLLRKTADLLDDQGRLTE